MLALFLPPHPPLLIEYDNFLTYFTEKNIIRVENVPRLSIAVLLKVCSPDQHVTSLQQK